jgi:hypothetical protein
MKHHQPLSAPPELPIISGDEAFIGIEATVADFWRWGFGDLRLNIVRGVLAEFLVAKALGIDTSKPRAAWDNFDLVYRGVNIEIKSAARWQSFVSRRPSKLVFGGLRRRRWDEATQLRRKDPEVIADVYIFAMHFCEIAEEYDPLAIEQWSFFVLPAKIVRESLGNSVSASSLDGLTRRQRFDELRDAVEVAAAVEKNEASPS